MRSGMVIWALSHQVPSTVYLPLAAISEGRLVKVTSTLKLAKAILNSKSHFAAGDNIEWSGMKRCGSAMSIGHVCALNIYEHLLIEEAEEDGRQHVPNWVEMRQVTGGREVCGFVGRGLGREEWREAEEVDCLGMIWGGRSVRALLRLVFL